MPTETIYEWFRGEREPNLDHLTRLAQALSESTGTHIIRAEIVAVLDGEAPVVPLDETTRRVIEMTVQRYLDEHRGLDGESRG